MSSDVIQGSTPYNPQLGTERQCTEGGFCTEVLDGGPAVVDPDTNEVVPLPGSGEIPAGSDLDPLAPETVD